MGRGSFRSSRCRGGTKPTALPQRGEEKGALRKSSSTAKIADTSSRYIRQTRSVRGGSVRTMEAVDRRRLQRPGKRGSRGRRGERPLRSPHLSMLRRGPPRVTSALTLVGDLMGDGERGRLRLMTRACWRRTLFPPHTLAQPQVWIVPPLSDSGLLLSVKPAPTVVFGLRRWEFGTMREHTAPWRRDPGSAESASSRSAVAGTQMRGIVTPRNAKRG